MVVTVSIANTIMSVPCAYRLYLPEVWTQDRKRCREAGIPDEVPFATKWEIALATKAFLCPGNSQRNKPVAARFRASWPKALERTRTTCDTRSTHTSSSPSISPRTGPGAPSGELEDGALA